VGERKFIYWGPEEAELPDKTVHVDRVVCGLPDGGFGKVYGVRVFLVLTRRFGFEVEVRFVFFFPQK
jgi:hypothetical protein